MAITLGTCRHRRRVVRGLFKCQTYLQRWTLIRAGVLQRLMLLLPWLLRHKHSQSHPVLVRMLWRHATAQHTLHCHPNIDKFVTLSITGCIAFSSNMSMSGSRNCRKFNYLIILIGMTTNAWHVRSFVCRPQQTNLQPAVKHSRDTAAGTASLWSDVL